MRRIIGRAGGSSASISRVPDAGLSLFDVELRISGRMQVYDVPLANE